MGDDLVYENGGRGGNGNPTQSGMPQSTSDPKFHLITAVKAPDATGDVVVSINIYNTENQSLASPPSIGYDHVTGIFFELLLMMLRILRNHKHSL